MKTKDKEAYYLNKLSKPELQVLAKRGEIKSYSKLTKKQLINVISELPNSKRKRILPKKFNLSFFYSKAFIITTSILLPIVLFLLAYFFAIKPEEVQKIVRDEVEKIMPLKEYATYIHDTKDLNTNMLRTILPLGYKVFGARDNALVSLQKFSSTELNQKYNSIIDINSEENEILLNVDIDSLKIYTRGTTIQGIAFRFHFQIPEIGEKILLWNDLTESFLRYDFYFVLLNSDFTNPVFAIGMDKKSYRFHK